MKRIIISLMVLAAAASASAQEAFKHIGAGIEVGTAGAGINVAVPVVNDHLTVKIGYNFPNMTVTRQNAKLNISEISNAVNEINAELAEVNAGTQIKGFSNSQISLDIPVKANLGAFKAMVEYYPFAKSSFHLVAGAFFGGSDFVGVDVYTDAQFWSDYKQLQKDFESANAQYAGTPGYNSIELMDVKANVNGETWKVMEKDGKGYLNAALSIAKTRPYVGLGFGRSIPDGRVAFKFDLGTWFHGTPGLESANKTAYDASASSLDFNLDVIEGLKIWPVMQFGVAVKLY